MLAPRKKLWSSPSSAIDIALQFAQLDANDIVYDVGCGDGRVLIQMAALSILPDDNASSSSANNGDKNDAVVLEESVGEHTSSSNDADKSNKQHQPSAESQSLPALLSTQTKQQQQPQYQYHHCKHFIGIEISAERAIDARRNVQTAYETELIPAHVVIEIICGNALDTTLIDYTKATVIFLYLVPRGLRLIKDIVWPPPIGKEQRRISDGKVASEYVEDAEVAKSRKLISKQQESLSSSSLQHAKEIPNDNNNQQQRQRRPRRIITYMAPFENTKHIQKEYCNVEHQMGAEWPVYLYHCS